MFLQKIGGRKDWCLTHSHVRVWISKFQEAILFDYHNEMLYKMPYHLHIQNETAPGMKNKIDQNFCSFH